MRIFVHLAIAAATTALLAHIPTVAAQSPATATPQQDAKERAAWEERFKKADTNRSGGLSRAELEKSDKNRFGLIRKHFSEMDANKDGEVTIAERDAFFNKKR